MMRKLPFLLLIMLALAVALTPLGVSAATEIPHTVTYHSYASLSGDGEVYTSAGVHASDTHKILTPPLGADWSCNETIETISHPTPVFAGWIDENGHVYTSGTEITVMEDLDLYEYFVYNVTSISEINAVSASGTYAGARLLNAIEQTTTSFGSGLAVGERRVTLDLNGHDFNVKAPLYFAEITTGSLKIVNTSATQATIRYNPFAPKNTSFIRLDPVAKTAAVSIGQGVAIETSIPVPFITISGDGYASGAPDVRIAGKVSGVSSLLSLGEHSLNRATLTLADGADVSVGGPALVTGKLSGSYKILSLILSGGTLRYDPAQTTFFEKYPNDLTIPSKLFTVTLTGGTYPENLSVFLDPDVFSVRPNGDGTFTVIDNRCPANEGGHAYVEISRNDSSCTESGTATERCVCGVTREVILPPKGHTNTLSEDIVPAHTSVGRRVYVCERCGLTNEETYYDVDPAKVLITVVVYDDRAERKTLIVPAGKVFTFGADPEEPALRYNTMITGANMYIVIDDVTYAGGIVEMEIPIGTTSVTGAADVSNGIGGKRIGFNNATAGDPGILTLEKISFPEIGFARIGSHAFYNLPVLKTIVNLDRVTGSIGEYAFARYAELLKNADGTARTDVATVDVLSLNATLIGRKAFENFYFDVLVLGDDVEQIDSGAFHIESALASAIPTKEVLAPRLGTSAGMTYAKAKSALGVSFGDQMEALSNAMFYPDHPYEIHVIDPTCVADGYTEHLCPNCGKHFESDPTPSIGAGSHTFTVDAPDAYIQGSCRVQGQAAKRCAICGEITYYCVDEYGHLPADEADYVIDYLGYFEYDRHVYEYSLIEPKCETGGYFASVCRDCGAAIYAEATDGSEKLYYYIDEENVLRRYYAVEYEGRTLYYFLGGEAESEHVEDGDYDRYRYSDRILTAVKVGAKVVAYTYEDNGETVLLIPDYETGTLYESRRPKIPTDLDEDWIYGGSAVADATGNGGLTAVLTSTGALAYFLDGDGTLCFLTENALYRCTQSIEVYGRTVYYNFGANQSGTPYTLVYQGKQNGTEHYTLTKSRDDVTHVFIKEDLSVYRYYTIDGFYYWFGDGNLLSKKEVGGETLYSYKEGLYQHDYTVYGGNLIEYTNRIRGKQVNETVGEGFTGAYFGKIVGHGDVSSMIDIAYDPVYRVVSVKDALGETALTAIVSGTNEAYRIETVKDGDSVLYDRIVSANGEELYPAPYRGAKFLCVSIDPLGHSFTREYEKKLNTCAADGYVIYACTRCSTVANPVLDLSAYSEAYKKAVSKVLYATGNHTYVRNHETEILPDCSTLSAFEMVCNVCGTALGEYRTVENSYDLNVHHWDEGTVERAATSDAEGLIVYRCTGENYNGTGERCPATREESIPKRHSDKERDKDGSSVGLILGIAGGTVAVVGGAVAFVWLGKRKKERFFKEHNTAEPEEGNEESEDNEE